MRESAETTMSDLEDSFGGGVLDEAVQAKVTERMGWVLPGIAETTRQTVQSDIIDGLDEGRNPRDVARDIRDRYEGDFETWRAERIARTEMLSASNAGTHEAHKDANGVEYRSWLHTRDIAFNPNAQIGRAHV